MATASQMIKEAYSLVGQPYLWGGNGETLEESYANMLTEKVKVNQQQMI